MGSFGKLWGAVGGTALGIIFYLIAQAVGGTCTGTGADMVCTVFGISNTVAYGIITSVLTGLGVFAAVDSRVPKA